MEPFFKLTVQYLSDYFFPIGNISSADLRDKFRIDHTNSNLILHNLLYSTRGEDH